MKKDDITIGFIGQGWVGKSYADNFEERGFDIVRYSLEEEHVDNRDKIADCDIVFIAVPTPTVNEEFDASAVEEVLDLVGRGKVAVVKSTMTPGTTNDLQEKNPDVFVFHSPEFLSEATAEEDVRDPDRNIVGTPEDNQEYIEKAKFVLSVLPDAPYENICDAEEAELIKYTRNCFGYMKVVFMNLLFDMADELDKDWSVIKKAIEADPMISNYHMQPVHKGGRGAGGRCFVKDFAAFKQVFKKLLPEDKEGLEMLDSIQKKNISLLLDSGKDQDIVKKVVGQEG